MPENPYELSHVDERCMESSQLRKELTVWAPLLDGGLNLLTP
jgi:hypothetical protein